MCFLVLDEPIGAQVEYLDLMICAAGGDASAVGVEFDSVYAIDVVLEHGYFLALVYVPHSNRFVI